MKKILSSLLISITVFFLLTLPGCHGKDKSPEKTKAEVVVAKLDTSVRRLFFSGTLLPINTIAVVSPVAGNVALRDFTYGERIIAGQKLLVLDSSPLAESYRKAVRDYLQKKQAFINGKTSFKGTEALAKAGVISKNDYVTAKTQFENTSLDYLQSRYALEKVLRMANIDFKTIETISLSQTETVNAILQRRFRSIEINAPGAGVALFPAEKSSDNDSSSGKLVVGTAVKEGQLLLSIGDLSGFSATFDVSEVDIDRIHKNMPVIVTGSAFPGAQLKGFVSAVSAQAKQQSGGGGLSMFSVSIKIPEVPEAIKNKIRVGMTAKFEVSIKLPPHIMLPINAVTEKNGTTTVTLLDEHGKQKVVPVVTGETTPTQVMIVSGVKAGDKVLVAK